MITGYRRRLLASTFFIAATVVGAPAIAQIERAPDSTAVPAAETSAPQDIVVTGSRISRSDLQSSTPVGDDAGRDLVKCR